MKRVALYGLGILLILGTVAFWQRDRIRVYFLLQQVDSTVETERTEAVERLAEMDEVALERLVDLLTRDLPVLCDTVATCLAERCAGWGADSPLFDRLGEAIRSRVGRFSEPGQAAVLALLPPVLNRGEAWAERFRPTIVAALSSPDSTTRARAVALAQRHDVNALDAVVPLLKDTSPEVRRAAMLAVGPSPAEGEPLIGTEELLPWLHDSDSGVRRHCEIALGTRGLSPTEIQLSRQITASDPVERLKALVQFPDDDDFRIHPWLERLSRDRDSAVRAGAARVAVERGIDFGDRLNEMRTADPDPSVRVIVEHFLRKK